MKHNVTGCTLHLAAWLMPGFITCMQIYKLEGLVGSKMVGGSPDTMDGNPAGAT